MEAIIIEKLEKIKQVEKDILHLEQILKNGISIHVTWEGYQKQIIQTSPVHIAAQAIFEQEVKEDLLNKNKELSDLLNLTTTYEFSEKPPMPFSQQKCPSGFKFGEDLDEYAACDTCKKYQDCASMYQRKKKQK